MKLFTTSLFCLSFLSACATIGEGEDTDVSEDDMVGDGDGDSLNTGGTTGELPGGSGGSTLGSGGSTLGSGGSTLGTGGSTLGSGGAVAGAGGSGVVAGDCNDGNSTSAPTNVWTTIPGVPCVKLDVPDWAYGTLEIRIQNNDVNVAGTVSVAGTSYTKSFGDISSVNAQTAILDLERGNSVEMPHAAPYYVKIDGNLTGQQITWEMK